MKNSIQNLTDQELQDKLDNPALQKFDSYISEIKKEIQLRSNMIWNIGNEK